MNVTLQNTWNRLALLILIVFGLAHALAASAEATASTQSPIANCTAKEYQALNFWLGDWDTFESDALDGPSIARARVELTANGCAVRELYEQNDGLIGDSILSYDAVRKKWQQTWVTSRGSFMFLTGNVQNGVLVLEGDVHLQNGTTVKQRISWKAEKNGVREWAVLSKDGGKTWTPAFDVQFRKRKTP